MGLWCSSQPGFGTPGILASRTSQVLSGSPRQWKSGPLTSTILLPPLTCLTARNEAVPTCSSSRRSLPPCISPLVTVPFLPPWTSINPRVFQCGHMEEGPWVYDQHLQSAHYLINQSIPPRDLRVCWALGEERAKIPPNGDSPIDWGDLSYLGDA